MSIFDELDDLKSADFVEGRVGPIENVLILVGFLVITIA
jgi:hypothetical protein